MAEEKVYVVIRKSGHVMNFGSGATCSSGPYLAILSIIAAEMNSAGSNYDPPEKLFLNGACVVDKRLSDLAFNYGRDQADARAAAQREVENIHTPGWAPDDERALGYNPPGIDKWTVRKCPEATHG